MSEEEGWKWLFNARKEHYFKNGRSLCGKYMTLGNGGTYKTTNNPCKACLKKIETKKDLKNE